MAEFLVGTSGGHDFALRSDQVIESVPVTSISRFMGSGRADVVAAVVDEQVKFLSDPAIRLGLASPGHAGAAAVIISARKQVCGLLFSALPQKINVDDDDLVDVAPSLLGAPFSRCFRYGGRYVGVLSESFLDSVQDNDSPPLSLVIPPAGASEEGSGDFLRLLVGEQEIAIDTAGIQKTPNLLSGLVPLSSESGVIAGIAPHNGAMIPVVDLVQALRLQPGNPATEAVVWSSDSGSVALAAQAVTGGETAGDRVHAVPPLLRSSSISHALVGDDSAIPIVKMQSLLSPDGVKPDNPYFPVSDFARRVQQEDLAVVEVTYGSFTYGIPETEVAETLDDISHRRLAIDHPLVDRVALLNEQLVPVLNLSRYLGHQRSESTSTRTLLIANGDFTAAVTPETVVGKRVVPLANQRPLPVDIPHGVLYGCYVEGPDVRLILNLAAIAQHAQDEAIQTALSTLGRPSESGSASVQAGRSGAFIAVASEPPPADQTDDKAESVEDQATRTSADAEEERVTVDSAVEDAPEPLSDDEIEIDAPSQPPTAAQTPPQTPAEVESAVDPEPEQEFVSAEKTIDDESFPSLEDEVEDLPLSAVSQENQSELEAAPPVAAPEIPAEESGPDDPTPKRRRRGLLIAIPILLLAAVGAIYLFYPVLFDRMVSEATGTIESVAQRITGEDNERPAVRTAPADLEPVGEPRPAGETAGAVDEAPATTEPAAGSVPSTSTVEQSVPAVVESTPTTEVVYFNADSWELLPEAQEALSQLARRIDDPSRWRIDVVGHSARAGTVAGAQWLSEQRATTVEQYLLSRLPQAPAATGTIGVGTSRPAASNDTDEGMAQNRRVVVSLVPAEN